jgi:hypothetical protein
MAKQSKRNRKRRELKPAASIAVETYPRQWPDHLDCDHLVDLANRLSDMAVNHPYDHTDMSETTIEIDHLIGVVLEFELSEITFYDLLREFSGTGFDIGVWVLEMQYRGIYRKGF